MPTLNIQAHCNDAFSMQLNTEKGKKDYFGYVPDFLGKFGDDVMLEIDLETGQILNWKKPTEEQLNRYFGE